MKLVLTKHLRSCWQSTAGAMFSLFLSTQLGGCGPSTEDVENTQEIKQAATLVPNQPVQSRAVWTASGPNSSGNLYYLNNNFSAANNPILGQINAFTDGRLGGAVEFSALNGAVLRTFNNTGADGAKGMAYLNGYYFVTGDDRQGIRRINADFTNPTPYRGGTAESITTDGTYLYANDDINRGVVHKYAVTNGSTDFTLQEVGAWNVGGRVRGLSHFDWGNGSPGAIHVSSGGEAGTSRALFYLPVNQFPLPQPSYPPTVPQPPNGLLAPGTSSVYQVTPARGVGGQSLLYVATGDRIYVWQYAGPNTVTSTLPIITLAGVNAQPGEVQLQDQSGTPLEVDPSLGAFFGLGSDATKLYVVHGDRISAFSKIRMNAAPALSPITASVFSSDGKRIAASVTATDDLGEPNVTYRWSLVSAPSGGTATFTPNGSNGAKVTTVAFSKLGSYTLQAIGEDSEGLSSAPATTTVVVSQKLSSVVVTPATVSLAVNSTTALAAVGQDQFQGAMPLGAVTWSVDAGGVGTISAAGVYTAPSSAGTAVVRATSGGVAGTANVTVTGASSDGTPYGGTAPVIASSGTTRIEAETYNLGGPGVAYFDNTVANEAIANGAPQFRASESVDVWGGPPSGVVAWFWDNEWLKYTVNVARAGYYTVGVSTASIAASTLAVSAGGSSVQVSTPSTGSWNTYTTTRPAATLWLPQGLTVLKIQKPINGGWSNLDYFELASAQSPDGEPYGGTAPTVSAVGSTRIEAEAYNLGGTGVAYSDNTVANEAIASGAPNFRASEAVDTWGAPPSGTVGWFWDNEWMKYTVNVTQAGFYSVGVRTAAIAAGSISVSSGANAVGISTPNTGSWNTYTTTRVTGLWLPQGLAVIRIQKPANGGWSNLDYFELALTAN